ncbi:thrombomodulin-like [Eucyclogobius newberryi]|uniref:thrombomodulin-like n=1 Tax=Eucyclogobius newberryi TaxID=166745 RepID=UPI003B5CC1AD
MMLLSKRALPLCVPLCVMFLCAAGEAPRGLCDDTKCWALYLESSDSSAAAGRCMDTGGGLYDVRLWWSLPALPHGHFWVKLNDFGCAAAAVASDQVHVQNRTCADALDGFMCQYTGTCRALPSDGLHVNYTAAWSFEGQTVFPPGTLAVVSESDHPPISKHICMGTEWLRAPWSCEVMSGGCEHGCEAPHACSCLAGQSLHHNSFTCIEDPCAECTHECEKKGEEWTCMCRKGYRLGPGGLCVDVDECSEDRTLCSGQGEACENEEGTYKCTCQEDYDLLGGVCVDSSICFDCEHFCDEVEGAFACTCRNGFRVLPEDPTKCEEVCSEQDCPAKCPTPEQCYCPKGYIQDRRDNNNTVCSDIDECEVEAQCDHDCENTFGGFICKCEEGFQLQDVHRCVLIESPQVLGQAHPTLISVHPTVLPAYVKTGSILGITMFILLCAVLLCYLLHRVFTHCNTLQFYSFKREIEIFTLQQVSTETYKRLSHDWQSRIDCHRL